MTNLYETDQNYIIYYISKGGLLNILHQQGGVSGVMFQHYEFIVLKHLF